MRHEACCDDIRVYGGDLYQWDVDRQVVIKDENIIQVHFSHCQKDGRALVVEPAKDDEGNLLAYIPNSLLTAPMDIYAWTWNDEHTISGFYRLKVIPRPRPDNYIYKPTDVITLESVIEWVKDYVTHVNEYPTLNDKPSINGVELLGDMSLSDLNIEPISNETIEALFADEGD